MKQTSRAWAEIDLNAIAHNYHMMQKRAGNAAVMCIVKANAYGHGAVEVAKRLQEEGASYFGVASAAEAAALLEAKISVPILILGYVEEEDIKELLGTAVIFNVFDMTSAQKISRVASAEHTTATIHIKLDTGMTRLGFDAQTEDNNIPETIEAIANLPGIHIGGIFTHFSVADQPEQATYTNQQMKRFHTICKKIEDRGIPIPLKHCANSAAILADKDACFDMVRAGISLYGYEPSGKREFGNLLRPAMTLVAKIAQVRTVNADYAISYGRTHTLEEARTIAVLTAGYADGFLWSGSAKAKAYVGGKISPVVGRICMDMCMVDVTDCIEMVKPGDKAILFGDIDGLNADTVANAAGTISYEVLCAVSERVPRVYLR